MQLEPSPAGNPVRSLRIIPQENGKLWYLCTKSSPTFLRVALGNVKSSALWGFPGQSEQAPGVLEKTLGTEKKDPVT